MIITSKILNAVQTKPGGYTSIQLKVLGVAWPPAKGWKVSVIGKDIKDWRILFYERDKEYPAGFEKPKKIKHKEERTLVSKKLDSTYKDTWKSRSKFLDSSYEEFLRSEHWEKTKKKAAKRQHVYGKCRFCGSDKGVELHHTSYKWINTKDELRCIIPLCREHHQEVHDYARDSGISVRRATNQLKKRYQKS